MLKIKSFLAILALTTLLLGPSLSLAYSSKDVQFEPQDPGASSGSTVTTNAISSLSGLGTEDPVDMTVLVVQWILGILALVFVVLIIYAGVRWMISGGNEEEITKAKGILKAAFIGLVIILVSYGVTYFIFRNIANISGTGHVY